MQLQRSIPGVQLTLAFIIRTLLGSVYLALPSSSSSFSSSSLFLFLLLCLLIVLVPAHSARVSAICFDSERLLILSVARDKAFTVHNALGGAILGKHSVDAWLSTLQYDAGTQSAFVGDFKGRIHVVKIEDNKVSPISVLSGHAGEMNKKQLWNLSMWEWWCYKTTHW